jgi:hypothetical protein
LLATTILVSNQQVSTQELAFLHYPTSGEDEKTINGFLMIFGKFSGHVTILPALSINL